MKNLYNGIVVAADGDVDLHRVSDVDSIHGIIDIVNDILDDCNSFHGIIDICRRDCIILLS